MKNFYITFGQAHAHSVAGRTLDKDCVALIKRETEIEAREVAFALFGNRWAFCYSEPPDMGFFPRGIIEIN